MARKQDDHQYLFRFHCADFEIEFRGDEEFVRHQLKKYEAKVMEKLRQLLLESRELLGEDIYESEQASSSWKAKRYESKKSSSHYKKSQQSAHSQAGLASSQRFHKHLELESASELEIDAQALRQLFEKYHPQTHHDRVMIFAYYLGNAGRDSFGTFEINRCYQALGEKLPANLYLVLNNATRSGFLSKEERAGKVKYRLTFKGKRYVENGLRLD